MKYLLLIILSVLLLSCKDVKQDVSEEKQTVQSIIDKTIQVSGVAALGESDLIFTFRDLRYRAIRSHGKFGLIRMITEGENRTVDSLTNTGFIRRFNYEVVDVPDSMAVRYSASVNSVHYFSVLPYGLNDTAVNKELLEDVLVKNKTYSTVKVTFNQNGGGEDFEDVFMYWINKETSKIDYLGYSYNETDGKGIRFREAYNERYVEGVRFVDYNNYKPEGASISLTDLPQVFEKGGLTLLSKIELETITVKLTQY
ncbi:MAG: hypothetical protein ACJA1H_001346 [Glaciecola sp.]|jgi:hypothetical protein